MSRLYVSPLKALINDQSAAWSGSASSSIRCTAGTATSPASARRSVLPRPDGVLLITPESLEALSACAAASEPPVFGGLRYVVVDELHAFLGTERGAQLQSLLHRVERARPRVPRIALSATLGDLAWPPRSCARTPRPR